VDSTRRRHAGAMDIEERNRQMKINKYKQVAGSDPRLEQDYHSKQHELHVCPIRTAKRKQENQVSKGTLAGNSSKHILGGL